MSSGCRCRPHRARAPAETDSRVLFRRELRALAGHPPVPEIEQPDEDAAGARLLPVLAWVVVAHLGFMAWTVFNAHDPALFMGGFLFFLGFARATAPYQSRIELKTPLLVGLFRAGLVIPRVARYLMSALSLIAVSPIVPRNSGVSGSLRRSEPIHHPCRRPTSRVSRRT